MLPPYVAVNVFAPDVVEARLQEYVTGLDAPVGVVSVHVSVPSETVTVPTIAIVPETRATVIVIVYGWPTTEGSVGSAVIVVVVAIPLTWWDSASELEA